MIKYIVNEAENEDPEVTITMTVNSDKIRYIVNEAENEDPEVTITMTK